jgi:hypothetical protein
LPFDCKCALGRAPVLNMNRCLLCLHLRAAYLSRWGRGQRASPPFLPPISSFPRCSIWVREWLSSSSVMARGPSQRIHRRWEESSKIKLRSTLSAFILHRC